MKKLNDCRVNLPAEKSAFSLMEMMVVMLIVAVVAAATAPMITRKLSRGGTGDSPWPYTGIDNNIAFTGGDDNVGSQVIIGAIQPSEDAKGKTWLYISGDKYENQIRFGDRNNKNSAGITLKPADDFIVGLTDSDSLNTKTIVIGMGMKNTSVQENSIAIGHQISNVESGATVVGNGASATGAGTVYGKGSNTTGDGTGIAVGNTATATTGISMGNNSTAGTGIAIGHNTTAVGDGIAIGESSSASGANEGYGIAIGKETTATGWNSISIGQGVQNSWNNNVVIGKYANENNNSSNQGGEYNIIIANLPWFTGRGNVVLGSSTWAQNGSIAIGGIPVVSSGISSGNFIQHTSIQTQAVGYNSVAIGNAAQAQQSGSIAIGLNAQAADTNNIAIGTNSSANGTNAIVIGNHVAEGDRNIVIGATHDIDGNNNVVIGGRVEGEADSCIALGSASVSTGERSVSIGTGAMSEFSDSIAIGNGSRAAASNSVVIGFSVVTDVENQIKLGNQGNTVYIPGNLTVDGSLEGSGFTSLSDRRLKNVGEKFTGGLAELKQLELFNFTFKKDEAKTPHVGVMAQDLEKVFPNAVTKGEDGFLRIRFEDMFYAAINAIKELDRKIAEVVEQVKVNIDAIQKLTATVTEQQKTIDELKQELKIQKEESAKQTAEFEKRLARLEKKAKFKD